MTLREHLEWIAAHADQETSSRASAALLILNHAVLGYQNTNAPRGYQTVRFIPDPDWSRTS